MLKAALTKEEHEKASKEVQALYRAEGDHWLLDVEPVNGYQLKDVEGLMSALSQEKSARKKAEQGAKDWEGLDVKAARDALAKVEDMKTWTPEGKVKEQVEALKRDLAAKYDPLIAAEKKRADEYESGLNKAVAGAAAIAAIASHKANAKILLPHVMPFIKTQKNDKGEFVAVVVDENGNPRVSRVSKGAEPMPPEEFVGTFKADPDLSRAWDGTGQSGTGSAPVGRTGGSGQFSISVEEAKDPRAYARVREAATKAGQSVVVTT